MLCTKRFLATLGFAMAMTPAFAQAGTITWNGFCETGVFNAASVTCTVAAPCKYYQKIGDEAGTMIAERSSDADLLVADVPRSVVSTWWIEVDGVAVTDVLSINAVTACANQ